MFTVTLVTVALAIFTTASAFSFALIIRAQ